MGHSSCTSLYEVRYVSNWFSFHYSCFILFFFFSTFILCACTLPESNIQSSSNRVIFMYSTIAASTFVNGFYDLQITQQTTEKSRFSFIHVSEKEEEEEETTTIETTVLWLRHSVNQTNSHYSSQLRHAFQTDDDYNEETTQFQTMLSIENRAIKMKRSSYTHVHMAIRLEV